MVGHTLISTERGHWVREMWLVFNLNVIWEDKKSIVTLFHEGEDPITSFH